MIKRGVPWSTLALLAILIGALVGLSFAPDTTPVHDILPILSGALPGLLAAAYAERTSRNLHNGVVEEKAKEGAMQALQETGVTSVVQDTKNNGEVWLHALTQILANQSVILPPAKGEGPFSNPMKG